MPHPQQETATGAIAGAIEELQWLELFPEDTDTHIPMMGAFGTVFRAKLRVGQTQRASMFTDVAVKALKIHSAGLNQLDYQKAVSDLKHEAHILQNASTGIINDFVVKFHGVVCGEIPTNWLKTFHRANFHLPPCGQGASSPELVALVMKYENGGTLEELLHGSGSDSSGGARKGHQWHGGTVDRVRLLMEISTGLWHLHNYSTHCIIHGDIKSANVLLSGNQSDTSALHVRLTDFGLSSMQTAAARCSRYSSLIHTAEKRGTWPYMAPEMYSRKKVMGCAASRSTDIYALGTLMWEVLCNQQPWEDYGEADRLVDLRSGETLDLQSLPLDTPRAVQEVIAACLSLDRTERPTVEGVLGVLQEAHEDLRAEVFDVFLSYAWGAKDWRKPFADRVYSALQDAGYRVWMDSIHMDHDLAECMERGIQQSKVVVVLLSQDYLASKQCRYELQTAVENGKERVVCMLDPGYWRDWTATTPSTGSSTIPSSPSSPPPLLLPPDGLLCAQLRLTSHLYVDLSEASEAYRAKTSASPSSQVGEEKLFQSSALPRLLQLLESQRKTAAAASATAVVKATIPAATLAVAGKTSLRPPPPPDSPPHPHVQLNAKVDVHSRIDPVGKQRLIECGICYEELPEEAAILCNGPGKHPLCAKCFCGDGNLLHQTSRKYRFNFAANDSRIICLFCGSPFSKMQVGRHARHNFGVYHRACKEVVEELMFRISNMTLAEKKSALQKQIRELQEKEAAKEGEEEESCDEAERRRQLTVLQHALRLYEHSLTLQCPRAECHAEVMSFEGSFVVLCLACAHYSCGWCNDCHSLDEDSMATHVSNCPKNLQPGNCYGTYEEYLLAHKDRRAAAVEGYLREYVPEELREEVLELVASDVVRLTGQRVKV